MPATALARDSICKIIGPSRTSFSCVETVPQLVGRYSKPEITRKYMKLEVVKVLNYCHAE